MDVFLFPLVNVTLFPKTTKPLNIFEPRYLEMIREAARTDTPVALGFIEDPGLVSPVKIGQKIHFVRELMGYGKVQIIEERSNGTLLVFIHAIGKCKIGIVKNDRAGYYLCESEIVTEDQTISSDLDGAVLVLNKILARWIQMHIQDANQREFFMRNLMGPEEIISAFASYLVRDPDMQQSVFEFSTFREKVIFLQRLAESNEVTL